MGIHQTKKGFARQRIDTLIQGNIFFNSGSVSIDNFFPVMGYVFLLLYMTRNSFIGI